MPIDPEIARARAQRAANTRWAQPGERRRHGEKITAAKLARHQQLVDPDGRAQQLREAAATRRLTSPERAELNDIVARAENSLRAEMAGLALKAAKARQARKAVPDEAL